MNEKEEEGEVKFLNSSNIEETWQTKKYLYLVKEEIASTRKVLTFVHKTQSDRSRLNCPLSIFECNSSIHYPAQP